MNRIDESIVRFMKSKKCASICCVDQEGNPYCFSSFYAFDENGGQLYFKSGMSSQHFKLLGENSVVAGTILPEKFSILSLQGIQFRGRIQYLPEITNSSANQYYQAYPFAIAIPGKVWSIQLTEIKMTNNKAGFGRKTHWERKSLAFI